MFDVTSVIEGQGASWSCSSGLKLILDNAQVDINQQGLSSSVTKILFENVNLVLQIHILISQSTIHYK